jgi:hypothetical protein
VPKEFMTEKVVVTNAAALKRKYGTRGYSAVLAAVRRLKAADRGRGVSTRLVSVDSAAAMKRYRGRAVTDAEDPRQNKEAIDAVFAVSPPDYLVLLGSVDVVPHQDLTEPLFSGDDPDRRGYSDLPYACEAPYGTRINDFIGPTRVVGRIPDLTGATSPEYLVKLLDLAANWRPLARSEYEQPLALTAQVWQGSTELSLRALFRSAAGMRITAPRGPKWSAADIARRTHFVNCHGAPSSPEFYGDDGRNQPVSHWATHVAGKLTRGTVAAVECCYGAELYDPALLPGQQAGIANVYLGEGAYGCFGSTTIAYGDADTNSAADLLCQYFLAGMLAGASLGRAALEAWQRFARDDTDLDPVDLKTLAQFVLLGDPSGHPVLAPQWAARRTRGAPPAARPDTARRDRRTGLLRRGLSILQTQGTAVRRRGKPPARVLKALRREADPRSLQPSETLSFAVTTPPVRDALPTTARAARITLAEPAAFHVLFARRARARADDAARSMLVAKEVAGEIVSLRTLERR